jgi:hypothetical protein
VFSDHAVERAWRFAISYTDVADAILDEHARRRRNPGSGDWLVRRGHLVVVYNRPDVDDAATARVITPWSEQ